MSFLKRTNPFRETSRLEACSTMDIGPLWTRYFANLSEIYGQREASCENPIDYEASRPAMRDRDFRERLS